MSNSDLEWSNDSFSKKKFAFEFVSEVSTCFFVYSESVHQLYGNYTVHSPNNSSDRLVILPDSIDYLKTYSRISSGSISLKNFKFSLAKR